MGGGVKCYNSERLGSDGSLSPHSAICLSLNLHFLFVVSLFIHIIDAFGFLVNAKWVLHGFQHRRCEQENVKYEDSLFSIISTTRNFRQMQAHPPPHPTLHFQR